MNTNCRKNDLPRAGGHELNQQAQKFHHTTANNGAGHCSGHKTASLKGDTSQTLTKLWRIKRKLLIKVALEKKGWVTRIFTCAYTYFCTRLCILTWQTGLLLFGLTVQNTVGPSPAEHPGSFVDVRDEPLQLFLSVHQKLSGPSTTSHWFLLCWEGRTQVYPHRRGQRWHRNRALATAAESRFVHVPEGNWVTSALPPTKCDWITITGPNKRECYNPIMFYQLNIL